jgi:hypothetical protein
VRLALVELASRRRLFGADAADYDVGAKVVLSPHRRAGQGAACGGLPDVRERIGDRALEKPFIENPVD